MSTRLSLPLALAAAFLLVPAGQAAAEHGEPHLKINLIGIDGAGGGVQSHDTIFSLPGTPAINCFLPDGASEQEPLPLPGEGGEGSCENEMEEAEPNIWGVGLETGALQDAGLEGELRSNRKFIEWKFLSGFTPGECQFVPSVPRCLAVSTDPEVDVEVNLIFACKEGKECPGVPLTLKKTGTGRGNVESSPEPDGIECPSFLCDEETRGFVENSTVTLTATPNEPESIFLGWHGADAEAAGCDPSGATATCEVEMTEPKEIEAAFDELAPALTINALGSGSGTVECEVGGGGTEPCPATIPEGSEVKVIAGADADSELTGLTGSGSAEGECEVESATDGSCEFTIEADSEVDATFDLIPHTLTVEATGEGSIGAVAPPAPVSGEIAACEEGGGAECSAEYGEGQTVTLEATPGEHKLVEWVSGCTNSEGNTCEVEIPAGDATVQAEFVEAPPGALTVEPSGEGSVDAEEPPLPISGEISACEEGGGGECSAEYFQGDAVTLLATPGEHQQTAWTGCDSEPSATECEVEIDAAEVTVEAEFTQIAHELAVTLAGSGSGTVECDVDGGGFGSCAGPIDEGSTVEVKATPAAHSSFDGFSAATGSAAGCEAEGSPCSFALEADSALTATFTQITHTLTVDVSGEGSVGADSGAITGCREASGTCAGTYDEGTLVTLEATPDAGHEFTGWEGCDSEPGAKVCEVELTADKEVNASFAAEPEEEKEEEGGGGGGSTPPAPPPLPPPPPTCLTNPLLCRPGTLIAGRIAQVKGNRALLRARCIGEPGASCAGLAKLFAKLPSGGARKGRKAKRAGASARRGKRRAARPVLIGRARFALPAGASRVLRVRIANGKAKRLLRRGRALKAQLRGAGIRNRVVVLKPAKKKRKRQGR